MNEIERVNSLSQKELDLVYLVPSKPVVHTQGARAIQFLNKWSPDYLVSKIGSNVVKVNYAEGGVFTNLYNRVMSELEMPFDKALELFCSKEHSSKSYYMQQASIRDSFPELLENADAPPYIASTDKIMGIHLWVGGAGCVTPLHYDFNHNFLIQISGRKELTLFSPDDSKFLYPSDAAYHNHVSEVDLDNMNHLRFPAFASAKPYHCILEPGDILFIPQGWWHHVRSIDMCISINYWWARFDIAEGKGLANIPVPRAVEMIQLWYLNIGFTVDHVVGDGEPILLKAIKLKYTNMVEALLTLGANPNLISSVYSPGSSALLFAVMGGSEEIVRVLLKNGANDALNNYAAFDFASKKGDHALMDILSGVVA